MVAATQFLMKHDITDAAAWKKMLADPEVMPKLAVGAKEQGAAFTMAISSDSPNLHFCIWECDASTTPEKVCTWMSDTFVKDHCGKAIVKNTPFVFAPNSQGVPPSALAGEFKEPVQQGGEYALVHHHITDKSKLDEEMTALFAKEGGMEAISKNNVEAGFFNHCFFPTSGVTEATDWFCLWELKNGKTKDDLVSHLNQKILSPKAANHEVFLCKEVSGVNWALPTTMLVSAA